MKKLLVVVDMQNDFIDGTLGTVEAQKIVPNVVEKIKKWRGDICVTQDTHFEDYTDTREGKMLPVVHCQNDTDGWQINEEIHRALVISEDRGCEINSFYKETFASEDLSNYLLYNYTNGIIDEIHLIGVCTDICVVSNALLLKAMMPEVHIVVDASCCAGSSPECHMAALLVMKKCQIDIVGE